MSSYWPSSHFPLDKKDQNWSKGEIPDITKSTDGQSLTGKGYQGPSKFGSAGSMDTRGMFNPSKDPALTQILDPKMNPTQEGKR